MRGALGELRRMNETTAGKISPAIQPGLFNAPFENLPLRDAKLGNGKTMVLEIKGGGFRTELHETRTAGHVGESGECKGVSAPGAGTWFFSPRKYRT